MSMTGIQRESHYNDMMSKQELAQALQRRPEDASLIYNIIRQKGYSKGGEVQKFSGGTGRVTAAYDPYFTKYGQGNVKAHILKNVGIAESLLDPNAVSPDGATGVMQLMAKTGAARGVPANQRTDPEMSIRGGSEELNWLYDQFNGYMPAVYAGYNAGIGNVRKAMKAAGSKDWNDWKDYLPRKKETIPYVTKLMKMGGDPIAPMSDSGGIASMRDNGGIAGTGPGGSNHIPDPREIARQEAEEAQQVAQAQAAEAAAEEEAAKLAYANRTTGMDKMMFDTMNAPVNQGLYQPFSAGRNPMQTARNQQGLDSLVGRLQKESQNPKWGGGGLGGRGFAKGGIATSYIHTGEKDRRSGYTSEGSPHVLDDMHANARQRFDDNNSVEYNEYISMRRRIMEHNLSAEDIQKGMFAENLTQAERLAADDALTSLKMRGIDTPQEGSSWDMPEKSRIERYANEMGGNFDQRTNSFDPAGGEYYTAPSIPDQQIIEPQQAPIGGISEAPTPGLSTQMPPNPEGAGVQAGWPKGMADYRAQQLGTPASVEPSSQHQMPPIDEAASAGLRALRPGLAYDAMRQPIESLGSKLRQPIESLGNGMRQPVESLGNDIIKYGGKAAEAILGPPPAPQGTAAPAPQEPAPTGGIAPAPEEKWALRKEPIIDFFNDMYDTAFLKSNDEWLTPDGKPPGSTPAPVPPPSHSDVIAGLTGQKGVIGIDPDEEAMRKDMFSPPPAPAPAPAAPGLSRPAGIGITGPTGYWDRSSRRNKDDLYRMREDDRRYRNKLSRNAFRTGIAGSPSQFFSRQQAAGAAASMAMHSKQRAADQAKYLKYMGEYDKTGANNETDLLQSQYSAAASAAGGGKLNPILKAQMEYARKDLQTIAARKSVLQAEFRELNAKLLADQKGNHGMTPQINKDIEDVKKEYKELLNREIEAQKAYSRGHITNFGVPPVMPPTQVSGLKSGTSGLKIAAPE